MNHEYYDSPEQEFWEAPACQVCDGRCCYLGALGNLHWWKCRHCGHEQHTGTARAAAGRRPGLNLDVDVEVSRLTGQRERLAGRAQPA